MSLVYIQPRQTPDCLREEESCILFARFVSPLVTFTRASHGTTLVHIRHRSGFRVLLGIR